MALSYEQMLEKIKEMDDREMEAFFEELGRRYVEQDRVIQSLIDILADAHTIMDHCKLVIAVSGKKKVYEDLVGWMTAYELATQKGGFEDVIN